MNSDLVQNKLYLFMDRHNWRFKMAAKIKTNFVSVYLKHSEDTKYKWWSFLSSKDSNQSKSLKKFTLINIFWNPRWPPPKITVFLPWDFEKVMTRSKPVKTWSNTVFSSTLQVWKGSVQNLLQEEVLNVQKASKMAVLA